MNKLIRKPSQFRYERKFFISQLTKFEVESMIRIHPAVFSEIYHKRFVNNIYFDTVNFTVDDFRGKTCNRLAQLKYLQENRTITDEAEGTSTPYSI